MLHAIYRYGWNDIYLANNNLNGTRGLTVRINVFDINAKEVYSAEWRGDISGNTSMKIHELPDLTKFSDVVFLDLRIFDGNGDQIDNNFYWLSKKEDILDYEAGKKLEWEYHTPSKQYADFTSLNSLPQVDPEISAEYEATEEKGIVTLKIKNPAEAVAFFIVLDVVDPAGGEPVLPVFWDDNHICLLPGETKELKAGFYLRDMKAGKPEIHVEGWNVEKRVIEI
jgi:exo-1,4-beta-D-glucosaminidase